MAKAKSTKKPVSKKKTSTKATAAKKPVKSAKKPPVKKPAKKSVKAAAKPTETKKSFLAQRSHLKKPLLIAAGALILIAGAIAVNYNNASDPVADNGGGDIGQAKQFSDQIIEHLRAGECQQIYDKTSEGFRAVITEENWLESCNVASTVLTGQAAQVELADSNLEDDITEYTYRIVAEDGETYVITNQLVYVDGTWLLQGIDSRVESSGAEGESEGE
jgi:hypothetical protein